MVKSLARSRRTTAVALPPTDEEARFLQFWRFWTTTLTNAGQQLLVDAKHQEKDSKEELLMLGTANGYLRAAAAMEVATRDWRAEKTQEIALELSAALRGKLRPQ